MENLYIVGPGMTRFGRHLDRSIKSLTAEAVQAACDDARIGLDTIQAAYFGNVTQGYFENQICIPGQIALLSMGLSGIPIYNVESACATGSMALHLALKHLRAGDGEIVLAAGAEKLNYPDREKTLAFFDTGWDVSTAAENHARLVKLGAGVEVPIEFRRDAPYSRFMEVYGAWCRYYMKHYGLTERQLAIVASKNHENSQYNPYAQYCKPYTVDDVLASAPVVYPLRTLMCSPTTDGAAAAIVCTEKALTAYGFDKHRAVRVRASVIRSASHREYEDMANHACRLGAMEAYEAAGLGPEDMDVAEVHDASAMGEIIQADNLGFCKIGEGGLLAESGATRIGGRIPINPSGGLECRGHPIGATGLAQVFELVTQLRGEAGKRQVDGARVAIQENGGGLFGVEEGSAHIGIFSRD